MLEHVLEPEDCPIAERNRNKCMERTALVKLGTVLVSADSRGSVDPIDGNTCSRRASTVLHVTKL